MEKSNSRKTREVPIRQGHKKLTIYSWRNEENYAKDKATDMGFRLTREQYNLLERRDTTSE